MVDRGTVETGLCLLAIAGVFAFFGWLIGGPVAAVIAACAAFATAALGRSATEQESSLRSDRLRRRARHRA